MQLTLINFELRIIILMNQYLKLNILQFSMNDFFNNQINNIISK